MKSEVELASFDAVVALERETRREANSAVLRALGHRKTEWQNTFDGKLVGKSEVELAGVEVALEREAGRKPNSAVLRALRNSQAERKDALDRELVMKREVKLASFDAVVALEWETGG